MAVGTQDKKKNEQKSSEHTKQSRDQVFEQDSTPAKDNMAGSVAGENMASEGGKVVSGRQSSQKHLNGKGNS